MISRRALSAAKRRMRDDPRTAAEVVYALVIDDDGDAVALTASQTVALVWWCRSQGEAYA